jgi:hypothetical protein
VHSAELAAPRVAAWLGWQVRRGSYQLEKNLPQGPERYTDRAQAALQASLAGLQDAVAAGDVRIGCRDLYFRRDEAVSFFFHVGTFRLPWRHKPSGIETDERLVSSMNINLQ